MNPRRHLFDESLSRRSLIGSVAKAALGVTLLDRLAERVAAAEAAKKPGDAKGGVNLVILSMRGAMSHLDTFDPKPDSEGQGETKAIPTKTPGVFFGEHLPTLASLSDRLAVIRSMTTETGAHEQGTYLMSARGRSTPPAGEAATCPASSSWGTATSIRAAASSIRR